MIRLLLSSAVALGSFCAAPALAQSMLPRGTFDADANPRTMIEQIGTARPGIDKDARGAEIVQIPEGNRAILIQSGEANLASLVQTGSNLSAAVTQQGEMNLSAIVQSGSGHTASVSQTSDGNRSSITQSGTGNIATISQGR
jgi:hypothetical protein